MNDSDLIVLGFTCVGSCAHHASASIKNCALHIAHSILHIEMRLGQLPVRNGTAVAENQSGWRFNTSRDRVSICLFHVGSSDPRCERDTAVTHDQRRHMYGSARGGWFTVTENASSTDVNVRCRGLYVSCPHYPVNRHKLLAQLRSVPRWRGGTYWG